MNDPELFHAESVAMDSPRIRWMRKWNVRTRQTAPELVGMVDEAKGDLAAWYAEDDRPGVSDIDRMTLGSGATEDEALADFAVGRGIRLWNEEAP
jgi:hypothetical protein